MLVLSGLIAGACVGTMFRSIAVFKALKNSCAKIQSPILSKSQSQNNIVPGEACLWSIRSISAFSIEYLCGIKGHPDLNRVDGVYQSKWNSIYVNSNDGALYDQILHELGITPGKTYIPSEFELRYTTPQQLYLYEKDKEKFVGDSDSVVEKFIDSNRLNYAVIGSTIGVIADYLN